MLHPLLAHKLNLLNLLSIDSWIHISICSQSLTLFQNNSPTLQFPISSSKNPPSCITNSFGTPWGLHRISEKIGHNALPGTAFIQRKPCPPPTDGSNYPTTRILRLQGLEEGLNSGPNCDSFKRAIYIHGTNKPELVGLEPSSQGCIWMTPGNIIELFNIVPLDTLVWIQL